MILHATFPPVINKFVMRTLAGTTNPVAFVKVQIIAFKKMAALAPFLRAFICGVNCDGLWQRTGVVLPRRIEQFFFRPILRNTVGKCFHAYAVLFGQLRDVILHAVNHRKAGRSFIAGLFRSVSPAAIGRFVMSVYIYPIKSHAWGARTHVITERLKGISPPITHSYSSATVTGVSRSAFAGAANNHHGPSAVESLRGS